MSDETQVENATTATETTEGKAPEPFKYDESRHTFSPAELEKGQAFLQQIADSGVQVVPFEGDWPEGAGLAIAPLSRNEKVKVTDAKTGKVSEVNQRICYAVMAWPIFPLEAIMAHKDGMQYLADVVQQDQFARILNPLRKQRWETGVYDTSGCPRNLSDHIEGMAADRGIVKAYTEAAAQVIKSLKAKSPLFAHFTPQLLRQYLSSKALASQFNAELEQKGFWVGLIGKLKEITAKEGGNTAIYDQWIETRDEAAEISVEDITLESLGL